MQTAATSKAMQSSMPSAVWTRVARGREGLVGRRGGEDDQADLLRGRRRPRRAPCGPPRWRGWPWSRRRRRYGAPGCRCARRSIRGSCRPAPPAPALVTRRGGRAEPVPSDDRNGASFARRPRRSVRRDVGEILGDLAGQVLAHHPRRHPDRVGDALVGGAAMALHDEAVEAEEDRAIMVVRIEMVAQQLGRRPRDQEADLRADRAGEGAPAAGR